jgi:RHH-type transcriptional regulator, rel operon repressor / antitoxin RelB
MATPIRLAPETEQRLDHLATSVLERVRKGQEPVHSAADLRADLGLGD